MLPVPIDAGLEAGAALLCSDQVILGSEAPLRLEPSRLQAVPLCHPVLGNDREAFELDGEAQPFEVLQVRRANSVKLALPSAQRDLVHRLAVRPPLHPGR